MGSGLVLERAGLGPRASLSAAVARNGPQAGQAEGRTARVPKQGGDTKDRPRLYTQPTNYDGVVSDSFMPCFMSHHACDSHT